jgi:hypothetical protein
MATKTDHYTMDLAPPTEPTPPTHDIQRVGERSYLRTGFIHANSGSITLVVDQTLCECPPGLYWLDDARHLAAVSPDLYDRIRNHVESAVAEAVGDEWANRPIECPQRS